MSPGTPLPEPVLRCHGAGDGSTTVHLAPAAAPPPGRTVVPAPREVLVDGHGTPDLVLSCYMLGECGSPRVRSVEWPLAQGLATCFEPPVTEFEPLDAGLRCTVRLVPSRLPRQRAALAHALAGAGVVCRVHWQGRPQLAPTEFRVRSRAAGLRIELVGRPAPATGSRAPEANPGEHGLESELGMVLAGGALDAPAAEPGRGLVDLEFLGPDRRPIGLPCTGVPAGVHPLVLHDPGSGRRAYRVEANVPWLQAWPRVLVLEPGVDRAEVFAALDGNAAQAAGTSRASLLFRPIADAAAGSINVPAAEGRACMGEAGMLPGAGRLPPLGRVDRAAVEALDEALGHACLAQPAPPALEHARLPVLGLQAGAGDVLPTPPVPVEIVIDPRDRAAVGVSPGAGGPGGQLVVDLGAQGPLERAFLPATVARHGVASVCRSPGAGGDRLQATLSPDGQTAWLDLAPGLHDLVVRTRSQAREEPVRLVVPARGARIVVRRASPAVSGVRLEVDAAWLQAWPRHIWFAAERPLHLGRLAWLRCQPPEGGPAGPLRAQVRVVDATPGRPARLLASIEVQALLQQERHAIPATGGGA